MKYPNNGLRTKAGLIVVVMLMVPTLTTATMDQNDITYSENNQSECSFDSELSLFEDNDGEFLNMNRNLYGLEREQGEGSNPPALIKSFRARR